MRQVPEFGPPEFSLPKRRGFPGDHANLAALGEVDLDCGDILPSLEASKEDVVVVNLTETADRVRDAMMEDGDR